MVTYTKQFPHTWNELVQLKEYLYSTDECCRSPQTEQAYEAYKQQRTREDFLKNIKQKVGDVQVALVPNDFPYDLLLKNLPNIKHNVIWSTKGVLSMDEIKDVVTKVFANKEWFAVEFPNTKKSVPEIWHAQVFIHYE